MGNRLSVVPFVVLVACAPRDDDPATTEQRVPITMGESPIELVYISNEDSDDLTVIDASRDSVVATIKVGSRPGGVKVSADPCLA